MADQTMTGSTWSIAGKWSGRIYLVLVYFFLLGPLGFVVFSSFNRATSFPSGFEGLTVRWYAAILDQQQFIAAFGTSTLVAALAALIATVVSFLAGYALSRRHQRENVFVTTTLASPLLVPQIVMSLAILEFAGWLGIGTSFTGLVAVHAVYVIPFALRLVLTGMARFDFALEEAATSLGANWWRRWRRVTLPLLRPSLVAGFTFCFVLSFVNLPLSLFITDAQTATLPIVMFSYIESRIDPMIAAVSAVIVVLAALVTVLLEAVLKIRLVD
jgi:putative spermidine/putrescine transport system permease protein